MKHEKKALLKIAYQRVLAVTVLDIKAPLRWIDIYFSDHVCGRGTAVDETFTSKKAFRSIIVNVRRQSKGLAFEARVLTKYAPKETAPNTVAFYDEILVKLGNGSQPFTLHVSLSIVLVFNGKQWQVISLHASLPDPASSSADTFHIEEANKRLQVLEQLVAEKTTELSQKNKELAIEAALEKVRSRSLAMQKSTDIKHVVAELDNKLRELGFVFNGGVSVTIFQPQKKDFLNWILVKEQENRIDEYYQTYFDSKVFRDFYSARAKGLNYVNKIYGKRDSKDHLSRILAQPSYQKTTPKVRNWLLKQDCYGYAAAFEKHTGIFLFYFDGVLLSQAQGEILQKFSHVFEQAYIRFQDLQKAEIQAREAQIEAALERIRTASLAMQDSAALGEIIYKLYGELTKLDAKLDRCFIMIVHPENNGITWWLAGKEGLLAENGFFIQMNQHPSHLMYLDHWKKRKKKWQYLFEGKEKAAWDRFGFTKTALARLPDFIKKDMAAVRKIHLAGSSDQFGSLVTGSIEPLPEAQQEIINRFARAFNQAYVRFLDLQKAEAQTREAQIEAALERVRAQSMAMHTSNELGNVVFAIDREAAALGIKVDNTSIITDFELREHGLNNWLAASGKQFLEVFHIPYQHTGLQVVENIYNAIENGINYYSDQYTRAEKNKYFRWLFKHSDFRKISGERKAFVFSTPGWTRATLLLKNSILIFQRYSLIGFAEEESAIFKRFGVVFDQAYTRFLDLQKAEAQAREAKIEASLERVRSHTMGLRKSEELVQIINVIFDELKQLGLDVYETGIYLRKGSSREFSVWAKSITEDEFFTSFDFPFIDHPILNKVIDNLDKQKSSATFNVGGEDLKTYLDLMFSIEQFKVIQPETKASYYALDTIYVAQAYFQHGFLEIAGVTPIAEDLIEVGRRFTQVIDLAYTRFLDLQKAEAQTREAQIQLALERVRARTMAMQHSDELADVSYLLNKQVVELGIPTRGCAFNIYNEHDSTEWFSNIDGTLPAYKTPREKVFLKYYDAGLRGEKLLIEEYGKDSIRQHYEYLFSLGYFGRPNNKKETLAKVMPESQVDHVAYFKYGYLLFITLESAPEAHDIFKRFAKEFEQTYTRFLDLQKSEAQTREAQIQLALERVRARSLAMHHTSELQDVVDVVAQQLHHIGIDINGGVFIVINEEVNNDLPIWASAGAADYLQKVIVPFFNKRIFVHLRDAFKKRNYFFEETYTKKEKDDMFRHLFKFPPWRTMSATRKRELLAREGGLTRLAVISQYTSIALTNHNGKQFSEADKEILKRFGTVFEQAYTRFLDLQKAEAQAREAQIEASLEKVRSVAMGMHKAADLLDICETSYAELIKLGFTELRNTMINIHDDAEETFLNYDYSVYAGKAVTKYGYHIHPVIRNLVSKSRAAQDAFVDIGLYGSEFDEWKKFRSKSGEQDDDRLNSINHLNYYFYSIGIGSIGISTFESISEQKLNTLKRFRNVFQLAYQRFTDLTLAEAQAREAQIETALERVRARTMAMQKSEELSAVAHVLFEEFKQLNLSLGDKLSRAFVITVDEEKESFQFFITTSEGNYLPVVYPLPFKEKTNGVLLANCWHSGEAMLINVIEGAAYKQWLKYLDSIQLYISPEIKALKKRVNHYVRFSKGFLGITANEVLEDDAVTLLQRFAKVFDQTFTRFVDLQIAEASAKEAIKQAALDRIRANIASMRRVEDLDRITPIIWNELRVLGIPFVRCGIFIMDESFQQIHTFLSSPNGGHIAAYYMRFQETPHIYAMVEHWRKHAKFIERWTLSEFTLLATSLYQQGAIKDQAQYLQSIPAEGMWLHFIPFIQGMLYVGNESSLPEDAIDTLAAVADAFSTAYARYEDFNKLEQAKTQVENTLVDLKQAQKQLVQSEKMASLGELTAGIAHEIQNPLNFVNNFSEVTQELLEELRQELKHGNTDGVQDLMDDIIQNLEKINHHGKRADGIVKGMLQHSRTSSGQKELVDINILCDEYLRLSYHGLRAKDKSFNAKFETSFDDTITKVNVMPQEMGRVILNLINNAFYAVSKKQQDGAADYVPTVRISTQKDADKILISVQDNGMGIPEQIKDKIFQPFFTTKPTGQGTGLGLSLSYDIIKAHGGQLSVISAEGEGTTFLIQLSTTV